MKKRTKQDIEKLAHDIIDGWELSTLLEYARCSHEEWLSNLSDDEFAEEWNTLYGEEEEEEDDDITHIAPSDRIAKALRDEEIKPETRGGCDHEDCYLKYRPVVYSVYDEKFTGYSETTYCAKHILEMLT